MEERLFYFVTLPSVYAHRYRFHIIKLGCDHDGMYRLLRHTSNIRQAQKMHYYLLEGFWNRFTAFA